MKEADNSASTNRQAIEQHYGSGWEASRLLNWVGTLGRERTLGFLERYPPSPPAVLLDVA